MPFTVVVIEQNPDGTTHRVEVRIAATIGGLLRELITLAASLLPRAQEDEPPPPYVSGMSADPAWW